MTTASDKLYEQAIGALEDIELPDREKLILLTRNIANGLNYIGSALTDDDVEAVVRRIESQHVLRMGLGALFEADDYAPWLASRQGDITWYYWGRYKKYLLTKKGFPSNIVRSLDSTTDTIIDHIEDPMKEGRWARKGLVVGDVQSGKTANYTGLICKAADAGYKVIIVLAGMLNSLRNQTQLRLDNDFMGWHTVLRKDIGSSIYSQQKKHPVCFTTSKEDFNKKTAQQIAMGLNSINDAIVFVVKKNKSTLTNLYEWLRDNNKHNLRDFSMLLIDDEADHASINTNKDDDNPTAINKAIRDLLSIFDRSSMVGYTATPFANIFIDPDTEDEMLNGEVYKDLFPRDFIYSLDPPTNFIGPLQIFSDEGIKNYVRIIYDNEDILPTHHNIHFEPSFLPESLMSAIRCFIIAKAIRMARKQLSKNHTLMINTSRFIRVQMLLKGLVLEYVKELRSAINNFCFLSEDLALMNKLVYELFSTWQSEYSTIIDWASVQHLLKESIDPAEVLCVNTGSADVINYDEDTYPQGRTVIVVGGLALSRGLTLEGLIVSYFLRNSIMYDTLMQMGRWFGYREGYQDLCRVFVTDRTASWYSFITDSSEELRKEIMEMSQANLTPMEFGLKVRSHPESLIVTSRNKMRTGKQIPVKISLEGRLAETSVVYSGAESIERNMAVLEAVVIEINKLINFKKTSLGYYWTGISKDVVLRAVRTYRNHPLSLRTLPDLLAKYLEDLPDETCDVLLRSVTDNNKDEVFGGLKISLPERKVPIFTDKYIEFSKRRVASRGDERIGIPEEELTHIASQFEGQYIPDKEYRKYRKDHNMPPLFMIQVVRVLDKESDRSIIVPCFGLSFPGDPGGSKNVNNTVEYIVNTVWWRTNFLNDLADEEE